MTQSFILTPPPSIQPATGYRRWFGVLRPVKRRLLGLGSAPQGGVYASAEDMGKFLNAFIADDSPLISNEMRAEMLQPQLRVPTQGLGWRISEKSRPGFIWHGGDSPGFAAFAGFDPRTGTALAVMANLGYNIAFAPAHGVTTGTAAEVFDLPPAPASSSPFDLAIVAFISIATLAGVIHAARLIKQLAGGRSRSRSPLRKGLSAVFGIVLVLLAVGVSQLPRTLFGAPIGSSFVFMPDMIVLLIACIASLALAGLLQLLFLFRERPAPQP